MTDEAKLTKLLRHKRLYKMMKKGELSKNNSLWDYLKYFAEERLEEIDRLEPLAAPNIVSGPKSQSYKSEYLERYFSED